MADLAKKGALAAIAAILVALAAVEGGYVNDRNDPGGETNHGITKRVAVANGYTGPMKALPQGMAREIYVKQYIDAPGFRPVVEIEPALAEELIDSGVNAGPGRAARWLQESLNALNDRGRVVADIDVDARVGPATIASLEALRRRRGTKLACVLLLRVLDAKQLEHYLDLGGTDSKFENFTAGWVRTRIRNVDEARCGAA